MDEKELQIAIFKISQNEIKRLRQSYKNDKWLSHYLFKVSEKIFKRIAFPYFRFEILLNCIADINDNHQFYINMTDGYMKEMKIMFKKLQRICWYLNIALEEFNNMLSEMDKTVGKKENKF